MIAALLLQIISLVPAPLEGTGEPDLTYQQSVQTLATKDSWSAEERAQWLPQGGAHEAALALLINDGNDAEVRLAAVLAAGADSQSTLGRALWRRAALDFDQARVMACLLAPNTPNPSALPIIAWIAQDQRRSLPVRAAAVARLLDADCLSAWPMARMMFLAGTAADEISIMANWPRKGRYELPKRVLLLSVQELLQRHQQEPTDFEPNAAWDKQVEQATALDQTMTSLQQRASLAPELAPDSWKALMKLHKAGSAEATASFALFRELAADLLRE
ncbi:MAG: hypothetical protein GY747_09660 [Planctomycetes bacterium]|nr:hypothetical protein [Planctomycetota bacterium]MCP4771659.1 hypothetical protein [Planctomycetota bacterium]MCP4860041.1 hypothetical protein [Planctomycetota bacterium]